MSFGKAKDDENQSGTSVVQPINSSSKSVEAFLGQGSKVVGNLTFTGPVELDGYIEGQIESKAKLEIGQAAVVNAKINGAEIFIKGTVNGDIDASERLVLLKPAKVVGNIKSNNLSIEEGVVFEGTCSMKSGSAVKTGPQKARA